MKGNLIKENGITLVALIITIIILLILAMVTISIVKNQEIIKKSQNAVNTYNEAYINEIKELNIIEKQINQYSENSVTKNNWWNFQDDELSKIPYSDSYWANMVAENGDVWVAIYLNDGKLESVMFRDDSSYLYLLATNENMLEEGQKVGQWYRTTNGTFSGATEYNGECPISKSDFEGGTIYCETYLDRIIENFNK